MLITEKRLRSIIKKQLLSESGAAVSSLLQFLGKAGTDIAQGEIIKSVVLENVSDTEAELCNYLANILGIEGKSDLTAVGEDWGPIKLFDCDQYNQMIDKIENHIFTDHILNPELAVVGIHQLYELCYKNKKNISREILAQDKAYSVAYDFCDILNIILNLYNAQGLDGKDVLKGAGSAALGGPYAWAAAGYGLFMDLLVTPAARKTTIANLIKFQQKDKIKKQILNYIEKINSANNFINGLSEENKKKYNCASISKKLELSNKKNLNDIRSYLSTGINIQFDLNSSNLTISAKDKLDTFVDLWKRIAESDPDIGNTKLYEDFPVYILGYASAEGSIKQNNELSLSRAESAADYIYTKNTSIRIDNIDGVGAIRKNSDIRASDRKVFITLNKDIFEKKKREADSMKLMLSQKK